MRVELFSIRARDDDVTPCRPCNPPFVAYVAACSRVAATKTPAMMPPTDEQIAKRVALRKRLAALPKHLRLGVTLPGMRELLSELPSDAVEQINAKIPLDKKTGKPKYPKNEALDSTATSNNS